MTYGIKDLCERFAVGEHTVLTWIRRGELKAINVGRKPGGRPKWRVTEEALAAFEQLRTPTPTPPRKRRKRPAEVIEFYK
jgi:excisionase family DNA binding protein